MTRTTTTDGFGTWSMPSLWPQTLNPMKKITDVIWSLTTLSLGGSRQLDSYDEMTEREFLEYLEEQFELGTANLVGDGNCFYNGFLLDAGEVVQARINADSRYRGMALEPDTVRLIVRDEIEADFQRYLNDLSTLYTQYLLYNLTGDDALAEPDRPRFDPNDPASARPLMAYLLDQIGSSGSWNHALGDAVLQVTAGVFGVPLYVLGPSRPPWEAGPLTTDPTTRRVMILHNRHYQAGVTLTGTGNRTHIRIAAMLDIIDNSDMYLDQETRALLATTLPGQVEELRVRYTAMIPTLLLARRDAYDLVWQTLHQRFTVARQLGRVQQMKNLYKELADLVTHLEFDIEGAFGGDTDNDFLTSLVSSSVESTPLTTPSHTTHITTIENQTMTGEINFDISGVLKGEGLDKK